MPDDFRWNAEMLEAIRVTPWKPRVEKAASTATGRSMYVTEGTIDAHGPTEDCNKCSTGHGVHSAQCRQRFEAIQLDLLQEKLRQTPAIPGGGSGSRPPSRQPQPQEAPCGARQRRMG